MPKLLLTYEDLVAQDNHPEINIEEVIDRANSLNDAIEELWNRPLSDEKIFNVVKEKIIPLNNRLKSLGGLDRVYLEILFLDGAHIGLVRDDLKNKFLVDEEVLSFLSEGRNITADDLFLLVDDAILQSEIVNSGYTTFWGVDETDAGYGTIYNIHATESLEGRRIALPEYYKTIEYLLTQEF
jgi:hypothetical protein